MKKTLTALALFIVAGLVLLFIWQQRSPRSPETTNAFSLAREVMTQLQPSPTPPPVPFEELTIPYLQKRQYQSSLTELQQVSQNSSYTSYLTSFDSDGFRVNGLLTRPTGQMPENGWPAIIFIHGYIPPTLYRTQERYVEYVQYLARNGFVVFKIDLRGHGNSEGEPGGAYYSSDYVVDTLNAYSALQNTDFVNPQQIGLWGHSMAGNVSFRALAAKPEIPAIVIWGGAVYSYEDFQEYGIDDDSYRPPTDNTKRQQERERLFAAHGTFNKESPFWSQVVPTNYLSEIKGAVQLHHAVNDSVVDIRYSQNLAQILQNANKEYELFEYQQGGHNLTSPAFTPAMQRTVEFFKKHLTQTE